MPTGGTDAPRLVVVSGAGRSGTSTVAGTLSHLGVYSPQPSIKANTSNPRGFFEPRWSVKFHNRLLEQAEVDLTDGRPYALDLVSRVVDESRRRRLHDWLKEQTEGRAQTVVKDPRTVWTLELWHATAADLGLVTSDLIMLRHPTEVHRSRATHYRERRDRLGASFVATNVAGWVNVNLMAERASRGHPRVFLPYADLVADWRTAVGRLEPALGLSLPVDAGRAAVVDAFVDPGLRRSVQSWDGIELPARLREITDQVWEALVRLAGSPDGRDGVAESSLDALAERYAVYYREAEALTWYTRSAAERRGRRLERQTVAAEAQARPGDGVRRRLRRLLETRGPRAR
ncbi:sulfotransferase family protein [Mumia sp. Pv 4-285]|uniref:sulfotransferase family protein n=1 Tax=Mumia qirimensis TaxID=3234852 RepID=UPI00351D9430